MRPTTEDEKQHVIKAAYEIEEFINEKGYSLGIAISALMFIAAEYVSQTNAKTKIVVEQFRRAVVESRKRFQGKTNAIRR